MTDFTLFSLLMCLLASTCIAVSIMRFITHNTGRLLWNWLIYTRATFSCSAEIENWSCSLFNIITETVLRKYLMSPWINRSADLWFFIFRGLMYRRHLFMINFIRMTTLCSITSFFYDEARLKPSLLQFSYFFESRQLIKYHMCLE